MALRLSCPRSTLYCFHRLSLLCVARMIESWNRLGTKVISKLRSGTDLKIEVQCSVQVSASVAPNLESDIEQALKDLGLQDVLKVQRS